MDFLVIVACIFCLLLWVWQQDSHLPAAEESQKSCNLQLELLIFCYCIKFYMTAAAVMDIH